MDLELLFKIIVPSVITLISTIFGIYKTIKSSQLSRTDKIHGILSEGVNLAESLGNLGKLAPGSKLAYVLNFASEKMKLSETELEKAVQFIENTYVGFFSKPNIDNPNIVTVSEDGHLSAAQAEIKRIQDAQAAAANALNPNSTTGPNE